VGGQRSRSSPATTRRTEDPDREATVTARRALSREEPRQKIHHRMCPGIFQLPVQWPTTARQTAGSITPSGSASSDSPHVTTIGTGFQTARLWLSHSSRLDPLATEIPVADQFDASTSNHSFDSRTGECPGDAFAVLGDIFISEVSNGPHLRRIKPGMFDDQP
jgi:hypothetical protein